MDVILPSFPLPIMELSSDIIGNKSLSMEDQTSILPSSDSRGNCIGLILHRCRLRRFQMEGSPGSTCFRTMYVFISSVHV